MHSTELENKAIIDLFSLQIWDRVLTTHEIQSLAHCQSFEQGNIVNWIKSRQNWNMSNIQALSPPNLKQEFCKDHSGVGDPFLVVFPERRTVEMAQIICKAHGGRLPLPKNYHENQVVI